MRIFFAALLMLLMVGLLESCKEGCKDKTALNYDSHASAENGTCMYCKEGFSTDSAVYFFTIDTFGGTTGGNTIEFIVTTTHTSISGNGCKSIGTTPSDKCRNYLRLVNLTNKNAQGFVEAGFLQNGSVAWVFQNSQNFFMGPPGSGTDTINYGLVDTITCSNLTTGTMNIFNAQIQFF